MENKVIYYYYENNDIVKYIEDADNNNELKIMNRKDIFTLSSNKFQLFENYETTHEDLIKYKNDFNIWCNEIKSVCLKDNTTKKRYRLHYKQYYSHGLAVYGFFGRFNKVHNLDSFEKITEEEFYIYSRCLNSGLISLNLEYKNKPVECYGYDYSRYYTNLLLTIKIPTKAGNKTKLENVEFGKLEFGIYRVKITYTNSSFLNIFNLNSDHHYNSSTLNYLHTIKDDYGLKLELLTDDNYDYNALIYNKNDLVSGKKIFYEWFKSLEIIREQFPKNRLVKHLMTSLWGTLSSYKSEYINYDDTELYDLTHLDDPEPSEYKIIKHLDNQYKAVKCIDAYKYGLGRIKPFLTAFGRIRIMKMLREYKLEANLIRIHTDGIIFNKPINFESFNIDYYPKPEDKTTGYMKYKNALYGYHICRRCNGEFKFEPFKCHSC